MDLAEWQTLIGSFGFPIFVAIFMMVKMDKTIKTFSDAINNLAAEIKILCAKEK